MPPGPAFKNKPAGGSTAPMFAADATDAAFARVATLLRSSKELHGCTVRAWDDPSVDQSPPGADGPPWIRLTPMPGEATPLCVDPDAGGLVHEVPMVVAIEASTPGTDVLMGQRLWGAIRRAIFPGGGLDEQLAMSGVCFIAVRKPAWGPPRAIAGDKEGTVAGYRCEGEGSIELTMYVATPE